MGSSRHKSLRACLSRRLCGLALAFGIAGASCAVPLHLHAQGESRQPAPISAALTSEISAQTASVSGVITDTDQAAISAAHITLENVDSKATGSTDSDEHGAFFFSALSPGKYVISIRRAGFAAWRIREILVVHQDEQVTLPAIQLGVEAINTTVNAITIEDLAEQQITAEEHQRILGMLPNFYVSYLPQAAPLTSRQKFKLAAHVSVDPITFFRVGVTAAIEQWQGDFSGYGDDAPGYAKRFGATYGTGLSSTFLGAALLPSLFHQDPRYFYRGHGNVVVRALYAISTVAICKGDNGHWQPNYSNVLGNLGAAGLSALYYPQSDRHDVQVTVDNTLIGVAEGAFGTLFQEFLLRHVTKGVPNKP